MKHDPYLSMVVVVDVEKRSDLLDRFFDALREFNADALEDVQIVVLSQKRHDPESLATIAAQPFPVDLVYARHECVGDYPIWDNRAAIGSIRPMLKGEYITFCHPEYFLMPGRLAKTLNTLKYRKPTWALGNLRRLGDKEAYSKEQWRRLRTTPMLSKMIEFYCKNEEWDSIRDADDEMPTFQWVYWMEPQEPGWCRFLEDVVFIRQAFLDAIGFWTLPGELPFQDVYDLFRATHQVLDKWQLAHRCYRLTLEEHKVLHLWHPKDWDSWKPAVRDWFLSQPDRWKDTVFLNKDLWVDLLNEKSKMWVRTERPVVRVRNGPGGTTTRFYVALSVSLHQEENWRKVDTYYQQYGRDHGGW